MIEGPIITATTTLYSASLPSLESVFYFLYWIVLRLSGPVTADPEAIRSSVSSLLNSFYISSGLVSVVLLSGAVYCIVRTVQLNTEENRKLQGEGFPEDQESTPSENHPGRDKWQKILEHMVSENSNDRRLAILEADIILDDLLDHLGYQGITIGDKLKSAEGTAFKTLQSAWEAHKIRNAIAHEGSEFEIPERESRRIIGLFESVFREFDYI
ncbi:MAG: hypothetical protein AAB597_03170 [Patescibacteria group bacterium]